MRIKRFEAPDTKTALAMVKEELGEDAVILASRTIAPVRDGVAKKGRESWVEVVAAMDYALEDLARENPDRPAPASTAASRPGDVGALPARGARAVRAGDPSAAGDRPSSPAAPEDTGQENRISPEARELYQRFARKSKEVPAESKGQASLEGRPVPPRPQPRPKTEEVAKWRDQLIEQLRFNEIPRPAGSREPLILALVGATGVGKTTTAAKLAAWFTLREGCRVAMLSMDCYRIGATDQLRTYARIMRLPCEIALRKAELQQALDRHRNKDVIIIDTAGKSPFDEHHIDELREWFAVGHDIKPYLVVSATTKKEDLARVLETYAPLAPESLIITKLDETRAYATVCQQVVAAAMPISYLCTGQRVPEDLLVASRDFLVKLFKHGWQAVVPELRAAAAPDKWQENQNREIV
jgi:flagellar biosynthesis protein FlhF